MVSLRPHDLLWLHDAAALLTSGALPAWATRQWLATAPVVVRREAVADPALVAVGLRGTTRSQRCAAYVAKDQVRRVLAPEAIAASRAWLSHPRHERLPCLRALGNLAPALEGAGLAWGVTGGAGFALATDLEVLREDSDLDLLVRAPAPLDHAAVETLAAAIQCEEASIDIQVETAQGAFSLKEWLRSGGPVLIKTDRGPLLCADPWGAGDMPAGAAQR